MQLYAEMVPTCNRLICCRMDASIRRVNNRRKPLNPGPSCSFRGSFSLEKHRFVAAGAEHCERFEQKRSRGELDSVVSFRLGRQYLAESYTGWTHHD